LSLQYRNTGLGFDAELRGRFNEGFPMNSGVYIGTVDRYTTLDLNLGYDLAFWPGTRATLAVQNIFDNKHREFVGAPELGRLIIGRLTTSF
jgi:iron complex outermembrane receptor protein